jgi:hypothetical protein
MLTSTANNADLEVLVVLDMTEEICAKLSQETAADDKLQKLSKIILEGWPDDSNQVPKFLKKYITFREELAVYNGLIFKGDRILIPEAIRSYALKMAHVGHPGVQHQQSL